MRKHVSIQLAGMAFMLSYGLYADRSSISWSTPLIPLSEDRFDVDNFNYTPSAVESYFMNNLVSLGFDTHGKENADTCHSVFLNESSPFYEYAKSYISELDEYNSIIRDFRPVLGMTDLRFEKQKTLRFNYGESNNRNLASFVCDNIRPTSDQIRAIFSKSGFLSRSSSMGFMEPLLPVARHPKICHNLRANILNMGYLIHDFQHICMHSLTSHSKLVFVDMGASLDFHGRFSPNAYIYNIYKTFGFVFDHIYAYEVTPKEAPKVYELVPEDLLSSWHWINVGVDASPYSKNNPFNLLLSKFTRKDDFVVVKLDIDTPHIELPLAHQLRDNAKLAELVDQFYFEYHVHQKELVGSWGPNVRGNVKDAMELMGELRKKGVAAHFWV
eukprot:CAMPEP_0171382706 /NCGR_PEP_ID=MMETSP0879-20121228/34761_1 /TAXON_ID=67004 /ORGANISM="Thalassiosira weissflogii, Strain CCMP1336" /LENGTH=384 /DNA_ID=CAMNT_0011894517 /DNA_START=42 /DNA_END=1196 /DNA_ORIENTATION=-